MRKISLSCCSNIIKVAITTCNGEQYAFGIETCLNDRDSIIATQRLFRKHFGWGRYGKVPDKKQNTPNKKKKKKQKKKNENETKNKTKQKSTDCYRWEI